MSATEDKSSKDVTFQDKTFFLHVSSFCHHSFHSLSRPSSTPVDGTGSVAESFTLGPHSLGEEVETCSLSCSGKHLFRHQRSLGFWFPEGLDPTCAAPLVSDVKPL